MSNETFQAPEVNDPEGQEIGGEVGDGAQPADDFTPELQEAVGDGADEQPGADGAPLSEDYSDPDDDSDDDAEGEGVGDDEGDDGEDDPA